MEAVQCLHYLILVLLIEATTYAPSILDLDIPLENIQLIHAFYLADLGILSVWRTLLILIYQCIQIRYTHFLNHIHFHIQVTTQRTVIITQSPFFPLAIDWALFIDHPNTKTFLFTVQQLSIEKVISDIKLISPWFVRAA